MINPPVPATARRSIGPDRTNQAPHLPPAQPNPRPTQSRKTQLTILKLQRRHPRPCNPPPNRCNLSRPPAIPLDPHLPSPINKSSKPIQIHNLPTPQPIRSSSPPPTPPP